MTKVAFYRFLFLTIAVADLVASALGVKNLHLFLKPLIMISLLIYYFAASSRFQALFALALLVCLAGDTFLLYEATDPMFFILGLISFLIAHVLFIYNYRRNRGDQTHDALANVQRIRLAFPVLLAGCGLVIFLYPTLGEMKLPVMVYSFVLVVMVLSALFRFGRTTSKSFWLVFGGAVSFMLSDSLLAIDKFSGHFTQASTSIMMTYCLAQYLITEGILQHEKNH